MAQWTYVKFTDRMIQRYEGGYCWDKADPGGPTKYGITCYDLAEYMGQKMDSMARWAAIVKAMVISTATAIYKRKYAAKVRYDELNAGPDACLYDYGVNSGWSRSIRVSRAILQRPGGLVMDDALLAAINSQDPDKFVDAVCAERLRFMHAIRGGSAWKVFGGGWGARVADLRAYCHNLAKQAKAGVQNNDAPAAPDLSKVVTPKAQHEPSVTVGGAVKGGVATGGAATTGIVSSGLPDWVIPVVIGVVIAVAVITVIYQRQKALKLNAAVNPPIVLGPVPAAA